MKTNICSFPKLVFPNAPLCLGCISASRRRSSLKWRRLAGLSWRGRFMMAQLHRFKLHLSLEVFMLPDTFRYRFKPFTQSLKTLLAYLHGKHFNLYWIWTCVDTSGSCRLEKPSALLWVTKTFPRLAKPWNPQQQQSSKFKTTTDPWWKLSCGRASEGSPKIPQTLPQLRRLLRQRRFHFLRPPQS